MPGVRIPIVARRASARGDARLRAAARLELRRRDPRPAGRVPAARRPVHRPGPDAARWSRDRRRAGRPAAADPRRARDGHAHAQARPTRTSSGSARSTSRPSTAASSRAGTATRDDAQLRLRLRPHQARALRRPRRARRPAASSWRSSSGRTTTRSCRSRPSVWNGFKGMGDRTRSSRTAAPTRTTRRSSTASTRSRTTSPTTGPSGTTDRCACS